MTRGEEDAPLEAEGAGGLPDPELDAGEERAVARAAAAGDFAARQTMIERNLRLVVNIAKHYLNRGLPLLDLVSSQRRSRALASSTSASSSGRWRS